MIRTYASDAQHTQLAQFFLDKGANMDQAYRWLRQHKYIAKGLYYQAAKVLAHMYTIAQSK